MQTIKTNFLIQPTCKIILIFLDIFPTEFIYEFFSVLWTIAIIFVDVFKRYIFKKML
jgi:hypothetical protein